MSIERDVITVNKDGSTGKRVLTQEDMDKTMTRAERKVLIARVLERGVVIDRATVELPPHLHGEWVHRDDNDIDRMRLLGFWIDGEGGRESYFKGEKRALHSDGTKVSMIGDVVFMLTSKENKEIIEEIRREAYEKMHGKPGEVTTSQKEEQKFKTTVEGAGLPTPVIEESKARQIQKAELESVLKKEEPKE